MRQQAIRAAYIELFSRIAAGLDLPAANCPPAADRTANGRPYDGGGIRRAGKPVPCGWEAIRKCRRDEPRSSGLRSKQSDAAAADPRNVYRIVFHDRSRVGFACGKLSACSGPDGQWPPLRRGRGTAGRGTRPLRQNGIDLVIARAGTARGNPSPFPTFSNGNLKTPKFSILNSPVRAAAGA